MHRRTWILSLASTGLAGVASAATYSYTCPPIRCTIPNRDYQYKKMSPPAISMSKVGIELRPTVQEFTTGSWGRRTKSFQFVVPSVLQIDHCLVDKISLLLHENGEYIISLRAIQNPTEEQAAPVRNVTTAEPRTLKTDHILRNRFHIAIRFYARRGVTQASTLGHPVVDHGKISFWVQRGQPQRVFRQGSAPRAASFYNLIDRVEVELKYEK